MDLLRSVSILLAFFQIVKWAHIVNAHALIGESLIHSLQEAARSHGEQRGLLLLANMSAQSFMLGQDYSNQVFDLAKRNREFVFGFISPRQRVEDPGFLNFSPGVHLQNKSDSLGQSYRHPRELSAVKPDGYIVGRGILQSPNPLQTACEYKDYCWKLFCDA